jgi:hypothetical protein
VLRSLANAGTLCMLQRFFVFSLYVCAWSKSTQHTHLHSNSHFCLADGAVVTIRCSTPPWPPRWKCAFFLFCFCRFLTN